MASRSFGDTSEALRVAVVGAGGIGNAVLPLLAGLPVRKLTIIDGDQVESHNLVRQPLFTEMDVGRFKASTLADRVRRTMPDCEVFAHDAFLDAQNAPAVLKDHDIAIEGVDDLHAKALIDKACMALQLPLVSGAVHGQQGQVIVLHAVGPGDERSRAQLFPGPRGGEQDGCDMRDVPLELLQEVARRMMARVNDVLKHHVMNGCLEVLDRPGKRWISIEPAR